jgi:hypothetical protein
MLLCFICDDYQPQRIVRSAWRTQCLHGLAEQESLSFRPIFQSRWNWQAAAILPQLAVCSTFEYRAMCKYAKCIWGLDCAYSSR